MQRPECQLKLAGNESVLACRKGLDATQEANQIVHLSVSQAALQKNSLFSVLGEEKARWSVRGQHKRSFPPCLENQAE